MRSAGRFSGRGPNRLRTTATIINARAPRIAGINQIVMGESRPMTGYPTSSILSLDLVNTRHRSASPYFPSANEKSERLIQWHVQDRTKEPGTRLGSPPKLPSWPF